MKLLTAYAKIKVLLLVLLCCTRAWATFTLQQHGVSAACTTTSATCAVTVSSTSGTEAAIVFAGNTSGGSVGEISSVADNATGGSSTWALPAASACVAVDASTLSSSCAYTLIMKSGATTITVTRGSTTTANWRVYYLIYSFTGSSVSFDVACATDNSTNSTTPSGCSLAASGSNDVYTQFITNGGSAGTISGFNSGGAGNYTFVDGGTSVSRADGDALNFTGTQGAPTWLVPTSAHSTVSGMALSEASGAAAATMPPVVN